MFTHCPLEKITLEVGYNDAGRYYISPLGEHYTSVTTCTSYYGKHKLDNWRKKVGEIEANRISTEAANIGTRLHNMCEQYLNNQVISYTDYISRALFHTISPALNRIDNIHLLESNLYSDRLQLAGSVDCVAEFDGILSIIDFKTSKAPKPLEWIENYFVQETIYASMVFERYHIPVKQIVTIITCRNLELQIEVLPITTELLQLMFKYINHYKLNNNV